MVLLGTFWYSTELQCSHPAGTQNISSLFLDGDCYDATDNLKVLLGTLGYFWVLLGIFVRVGLQIVGTSSLAWQHLQTFESGPVMKILLGTFGYF